MTGSTAPDGTPPPGRPPAGPPPPRGSDAEETLGAMIAAAPTREVLVRPRTILLVIAVGLGAWLAVGLVRSAWQVLTWILAAAFLAMALEPAVRALERRALPRTAAVLATTVMALAAFAVVLVLVVPPMVEEMSDLVAAIPEAVEDASRGEGALGRLEREYGIVERVREAVETRGAEGILGITTPALSVVQGILSVIAATVTIFFLTIFMLLEGKRWAAQFLDLVPERTRPTWERILGGVSRTVAGYVTGNLFISVIAGTVATVTLLLLDVPYALPLGLLVAVLDLVPLVGATAAAVIVCAVAWVTAGPVALVVLIVVFVVYQNVENHLLQPLVYGRAVQLSPLAVLVSVLIGAELAGIFGALVAIPIGASVQVVVREIAQTRRERRESPQDVPPSVW